MRETTGQGCGARLAVTLGPAAQVRLLRARPSGRCAPPDARRRFPPCSAEAGAQAPCSLHFDWPVALRPESDNALASTEMRKKRKNARYSFNSSRSIASDSRALCARGSWRGSFVILGRMSKARLSPAVVCGAKTTARAVGVRVKLRLMRLFPCAGPGKSRPRRMLMWGR